MPKRRSAVSIVTGNVAALLLVKRAMSTAGIMRPNTWIGLRPRINRNRGRTTKNWMTLPPKTTSTYLPMESATTPALTWADNWAAKATMPNGSVQMSQWISRKSSSCKPDMNFTTTALFSDSGSFERPMPTAKANNNSESTLPSKKGRTMLLGMTEIR